MKEIVLLVGTDIAEACQVLAREAPAYMDFNLSLLYAAPGDRPEDILARWRAEQEHDARDWQLKRQAFEASPAGQVVLTASAAAQERARRQREEALRTIEASGVRSKYPWTTGMGEIGGFNEQYESVCRDMLYAGLSWLDAHPGEMPNMDGLETVLMAACPGSSGSQLSAAAEHTFFIAKHGWPEYVRRMTADERD